ncbi:hypothetical protein [Actinoallomurus rhizosphaericola]|nr:hypothetical protein [Actinoallomurus rhizosphaericola]
MLTADGTQGAAVLAALARPVRLLLLLPRSSSGCARRSASRCG